MKKFYSLLALAMMVLFPTALWAKTVTFTINNPESAYLFNSSNYQSYSFDGETTKVLELDDSSYIDINVASGYVLEEVTIDNTKFSGTSLSPSDLTDGCKVNITTGVKTLKVVYIVADPTIVSLTVDYSNVYNASNMADGKWTIELPNEYAYMDITCAGDNVITSIKSSTGEEILQDSQKLQPYISSFYTGALTDKETYTITCGKIADMRTAHVSVTLGNGEADQVTIRRNGSYEPIPSSEWNDIAFVPEVETPLTIESSTYNTALYKVEVNGEQVESSDLSYILFDLKDGDKITVYPDFPDIAVPVSFTMTNEGTEDAITVKVNNETVPSSQWSAKDYTVKLGSLLEVNFNTGAYNITSATCNGESMESYGYFNDYQKILSTEDPISFNITATKLREYEVTILYEYGTITVTKGDDDTPVELGESEEVKFTVSPNDSRVTITAAEGYVIESIIDAADKTYTSPLYIDGDIELIVLTTPINRDNLCVVYMEKTDQEFYAHEITLSPYDPDIRLSKEIEEGYTFINYGDFDLPFMISFYPEADVYLNGEKSEQIPGQGFYSGMETMKPNSVIKIFPKDFNVTTYALTVDNKSEGAVMAYADYITPVESAQAQVFGPTDIEFITVAATTEGKTAYIVKVNGETVNADEKGRVIAHIDADSTISIEANTESSISEISAEAPAAVYNLQGVRVSNPRNGLFIQNGKKVIL